MGLGTDGASSGNTLDLFTLFKLFADFQKTAYHDRSLFPADGIVKIGTMGGALALGAGQELGSIEAGKKADLVIVETDSVNMFLCQCIECGHCDGKRGASGERKAAGEGGSSENPQRAGTGDGTIYGSS